MAIVEATQTPDSGPKLPGLRPGGLKPMRKPGSVRFKPPTRPPPTPKPFKPSQRPRKPFVPTPPPAEVLLEGGFRPGSGYAKPKTTKAPLPKTTTRPAILDIDHCKPGCNAANREICKEMPGGKYRCDCRPGFTKRPGSEQCHGKFQN